MGPLVLKIEEIQASLEEQFDNQKIRLNETLMEFGNEIENVKEEVSELSGQMKKTLYRCPTEKNGYKLLAYQCYFFEKVNRDYGVTQEKCKSAFGPNVIGKMWEPKSLLINNVVGNEARSYFGQANGDRFWIGITNDGLFRYQSNRESATWNSVMPFRDENEKVYPTN